MSQKLYRRMGERIKTHRKLRHLTQEQLSEKADLTVHYLSRIETGSATPTLESLDRIAHALGVQIGELFLYWKDEPEEATELLRQITRLLRNRRPEELRTVRNLIGQFVEVLPPIKA